MTRETEKINRLIMEQFDGNMKKCADTLGVSPSTISRAVSGKNKPGLKLIKKIIGFCYCNNLKHELYVDII